MDGWKMDPFPFGMANFQQAINWQTLKKARPILTFPTTEESNGENPRTGRP